MTADAQSASAPAAASAQRTALALVAGWFVPGLGHVVLGRVRRGVLFGAIILGSFAFGMAHEGRHAQRDDRQPVLSMLQFVANAGDGVGDLIARFAVYGSPVYALPRDPSDPRYVERIRTLRDRSRSLLSNYGTAYLWTAGLMNLLLLFDVRDIAASGESS